MIWLWRICLVSIAGLLCWQIIQRGMAEHYVRLPGQVGLDRALAWNETQAQALLRKGEALAEVDPEQATLLLQRAVQADPTDASPKLALARLAKRDQGISTADALIEQAVRLEPASRDVLTAAYEYWSARGDFPRAIAYVAALLTADGEDRKPLFRMLTEAAENPAARSSLTALTSAPPSWWGEFFAELAAEATDFEVVMALYSMRQESPVPLSSRERHSYIDRLMKEGRVAEAHQVWAHGLVQHEGDQSGFLYNGGFELEMGTTEFGWRQYGSDDVLVTTGWTNGARGDKALHVVFQGTKPAFTDLYQSLFLNPGAYRVNGRIRPELLEPEVGVKWVVSCPQANGVIGESEFFRGAGQWREFIFEFSVPLDCSGQELSLVSAARGAMDKGLMGGVWFDDLSIHRMDGGTPQANPAIRSAVATDAEPVREN